MLKEVKQLRTWLESCKTNEIAAIAAKAKVSNRTVWNIRRGTMPSLTTLHKLLKVMP